MAYKKRDKIEKTFKYFNPHSYLSEYYTKIGPENYNLLKYFAKAYKNTPRGSILLEFGGGPTIYQLISVAGRVKEIHFSDYLEANLGEVKKWVTNEKDAFDWKIYIKESLKLEGHQNIKDKDITDREQMLKSKLTKFLYSDAFSKDPIGPDGREKYNVVSVNFVPEGITTSQTVWRDLIKNITSTLKKGGIFVTAAVREADYWKVGERKFPACFITEKDLIEVLVDLDFTNPCVNFEVIEAEDPDPKSSNFEGYRGVFLLKAIK